MNHPARIVLACLLFSVMLLVSPALLAAGTLFGAATNYDFYIPCMCVAAGDYSGEGATDFIATSTPDWYMTAYGSGTGTFFVTASVVTTGVPASIAFGFFNDDDDLDMALACPASNWVAVHMNDGAAGFYGAVNYATGVSPVSVVAGDLNDDGYDDLVTANSGDDTVTVLLNDQDWTFTSTDYDIDLGDPEETAEPSAVALGDFDGDDDLDIVVLLRQDASFQVLCNDGTGAFTFDSTKHGAGTNPVSVVSADFDDDGFDDIVVANNTDSSGANQSVCQWNGGGSSGSPLFTGPSWYEVGDSLRSICAGDFDADGNLDFALADENDDQVSVLLGDGEGAFGTADSYDVGDGPVCVVAGDFDSNGACDLATANAAGTDVSVLLSLGSGTTTVDLDLNLQTGWNMISVPVTVGGNTVAEVFAEIDHGDIYTWVPAPAGGSYLKLEDADVIDPHCAYWVSIATAPAEPVTLTGEPVSVDEWSADLLTGWNMVGTAYSETPIPLSDLGDGGSGALQDDAIYWWDAEHTEFVVLGETDDLVPGVGYWMACTAGCTITMTAPEPQ